MTDLKRSRDGFRKISPGVQISAASANSRSTACKPLLDILGDAVEQEGRRLAAPRTLLPNAQQGAVEQDGRGSRIRSHAGWYAGLGALGNPAAVPDAVRRRFTHPGNAPLSLAA